MDLEKLKQWVNVQRHRYVEITIFPDSIFVTLKSNQQTMEEWKCENYEGLSIEEAIMQCWRTSAPPYKNDLF